MRRVDRAAVPPPACLTTPSAAVASERTAVAAHYGEPPARPPGQIPPRVRPLYNDFTQYKSYEVATALDLLFHGKCAYCESHVGPPSDEEIEHYRPKGGVTEDDDHNGYWWLASDWNNLLLSCTHCNQGRKQHIITPDMDERDYLALVSAPPRTLVGKQNQFPVGGSRARHPGDDLAGEDPLLIDPTGRDPAPSFAWCNPKDLSIVLAAQSGTGEDPHGTATIAICALNRWKLVRARTTLLQQLRLFRDSIFKQLEKDDSPAGVARAMDSVDLMRSFAEPDHAFSAMAHHYVEEVSEELRSWLAKPKPRPSDG